MPGSNESAPETLLQLLVIVLLLAIATPQYCAMTCDGGLYVPPRDRAVLVYTTLAAALVLWLAEKAAAADGGGWLLRGLLLLGIGLSVASSFLLLEPHIGYAIVIYRLGCHGSATLAAVGGAAVAVAAGTYFMFAAEALFGR